MTKDKYNADFERAGSNLIYTPLGILIMIALVIALTFLIIQPKGVLVLPGIIVIGGLAYFLIKNAEIPVLSLKTIVIAAFLINGITRFLPLPLGLSVDALLLLGWLTLLFKSYNGLNWSPMKNLFTLCFGIWAFFIFLQLLNPQAISLMAWFYASRGLAFYGFLCLPLIFMLFNQKSDMKWFIDVWFIMSILMGLYGAKQFWLGLFGFETKWLNEFGYVTHVLWGKFTRMFSFASDANQFGISQAHCATVAVVFSIYEKEQRRKIFYLATAFITLYGMFISGTRGAMVIPGVGAIIYLILSKNYRIIAIGSIFGIVIYVFLAHTHILNSVAPIQRMRTVFQASKDESFKLRMTNRKILAQYMKDKPFGGGVGAAGNWGNRFSPGTFLAEFETDGMYVRIFAETGIVGLYLYYILYFIMLMKMLMISWKLKKTELRMVAIGLTCGVFGVMASNYGADNSVGLPTSMVMYWSFAIIWMTQKWDRGEEYPMITKSK